MSGIGTATPQAAGSAGQVRNVLARGLCRFKLFRAPEGLSRRQLALAARTFAEAHKPFENSQVLVLRSPLGAEIWYWDHDDAAKQSSLTPESVLRPPGDGWRILACEEGFEAQYWERGGLCASTWRRQMFSRDQWTGFVLGVEEATQDAPDAPPDPEHTALAQGNAWRRRAIRPPPTWRDVEVAALTGALCALGLAAFFVGQALHFEHGSRATNQELALVEEHANADPRLERMRQYSTLLRDYAGATAGVDVLGASAQALEVMHQFGVTANAWRVDQSGFRATLDASMSDVPLREIVAALEATPLLCRVEPNLSSGQGALELTARIDDGAQGCEQASGVRR